MKSTSVSVASVRNFIYLDSEKLRSHSSQVFEGVTEYISTSLGSLKEERTEQKGPVGTGKIVGDIFRTEGSSTELKFLEDYAYVLFEQKLEEDQRVSVISSAGGALDPGKQYVKVCSRLTLNDLKEVVKIIEGFNDFGEAMYRITNQAEFEKKSHGKPISDAEVRTRAKAQGMSMDKKQLESLSHVLRFGYKDSVEANLMASGLTFSAPLKRNSLREEAPLLIQKYSRYSQREMTLLGVLTQVGKNSLADSEKKDVSEANNVREAIRYLIGHMKELEDVFMGQLDTDVMVDPIAIYA